jgi:Uma2 family endonuclease
MATEPSERLLTAKEFLQIDFGTDLKAELDDGVIRMMAGGTRDHARIQANVLTYLRVRLRGSGCRPYGSDMAVQTHERGVRYPDVSIDCGSSSDQDTDKVLRDPRVIIEILSPSTRDVDLRVKRAEYRELESIVTIVFIDPTAQTVSVSQRGHGSWIETLFARSDIELPALNLLIPHDEIFARD